MDTRKIVYENKFSLEKLVIHPFYFDGSSAWDRAVLLARFAIIATAASAVYAYYFEAKANVSKTFLEGRFTSRCHYIF